MNNSTAAPAVVYPYGVAPMSDPRILAGTLLSSVLFFICFFAAFWIVITRDSRLVQQSQPATTFISLFSLALLNGSLLIAIGRPMSVGLCVGRLWGTQLAMFIFLSSQLMKGWTLFKFNQTARVSFLRLWEERDIVILLVFLLIFSIILILWIVFEPLSVNAKADGCKSAGQIAEVATIVCLSLLWLFWGFFSSQTYELKSRFTDYASITCFVTGLAGVMAIIAGNGFRDTVFVAENRFVTESVCAAAVSLSMLCLGIAPKMCSDELFDEDDGDVKQETTSRGKTRRRGTSASTANRNLSVVSVPSLETASTGRGSVHEHFTPRKKNIKQLSKLKSSDPKPPNLSERRNTPEQRVVVFNVPPPNFADDGMWL